MTLKIERPNKVAVSVLWGAMVEPMQEEAIGAQCVIPGPLFFITTLQ